MNEILCPNCGASVPSNTEICPFCGSELIDLSREHTDKKISYVKEQKKKMLSVPMKIAIVISSTFLVLFLITAGIFVFHIPEKLEKAKYEHDMASIENRMEKAYQNEDWDMLYDYVILNCDTYLTSPSYFKYRTIWFLATFPKEFDEAIETGDTEKALDRYQYIKDDYSFRNDFFYQHYTVDKDVEKQLKDEYDRETAILEDNNINIE